ncbi:MAG: phosphatidylserine decarboxylase family protein [Longimicrobiales bacterium]
MIRLAPEGWPFIIIGAVVTGVLVLSGWALGGHVGPAWRAGLLAAAGAMLLLTLFTVFFFRNPEPTVPADGGLVVAPGSGRVIQITEVEEPTFMKGPATRISIFLSVFNVHVQRAPLSGEVRLVRYDPGRYLAAWNPKASEENEQASIGIQAGPHRVLVRQIAGLVARRVVTDPVEGDTVTRGERIGIIRFGSRVDLFLPPDWEILCDKGDPVRVGETPLARIPDPSGPDG